MKNYLERVWMEVVVAYFKALSQHYHGRTEESTKTFGQNSWYSLQRFEPRNSQMQKRNFIT
jgi:hypothetical protein